MVDNVYGPSSGGASVLTFCSLTMYLCVNEYDEIRRPRHSGQVYHNYVRNALD